MKADFYEVLGVAEDANFDAIRSAYKSAVKRFHPDRGGTAEEFESVRLAYECLSDPAQREAYDRTRSSGESDADEADAKAIERLRTTIIGIVSFLSEKPAKGGGVLSEPAQFAMLADGSFLDTLDWQFRNGLPMLGRANASLKARRRSIACSRKWSSPSAESPIDSTRSFNLRKRITETEEPQLLRSLRYSNAPSRFCTTIGSNLRVHSNRNPRAKPMNGKDLSRISRPEHKIGQSRNRPPDKGAHGAE
jgi:curved DNA-binding protein CbpA